MSYEIMQLDVLAGLARLQDNSVHCVVTSPPYWGLRDYGVAGQLGLESTPSEFIGKMVQVFREVRRVLRPDGTCWVNMGDSYANSGACGGGSPLDNRTYGSGGGTPAGRKTDTIAQRKIGSRVGFGLKPKDLCGIPWRLAIALQEDGWWLRQDIIWAKPNPMPESVTDRCTKAHEYLFLLTKRESYFFDAKAIQESCSKGDAGSSYVSGKTAIHQEGRAGTTQRRVKVPGGWDQGEGAHGTIHRAGRTEATYQEYEADGRRNKRSVWTIAPQAYPEAHFATFPEALVTPCVLAGCPEGGTVLDPFSGSGTTGVVALRYQRNYIGIELNPEYVEMSRRRIRCDRPLFNVEVAG